MCTHFGGNISIVVLAFTPYSSFSFTQHYEAFVVGISFILDS